MPTSNADWFKRWNRTPPGECRHPTLIGSYNQGAGLFQTLEPSATWRMPASNVDWFKWQQIPSVWLNWKPAHSGHSSVQDKAHTAFVVGRAVQLLLATPVMVESWFRMRYKTPTDGLGSVGIKQNHLYNILY